MSSEHNPASEAAPSRLVVLDRGMPLDLLSSAFLSVACCDVLTGPVEGRLFCAPCTRGPGPGQSGRGGQWRQARLPADVLLGLAAHAVVAQPLGGISGERRGWREGAAAVIRELATTLTLLEADHAGVRWCTENDWIASLHDVVRAAEGML